LYPNFCTLYNLEITELTKCRTCRHAHYKPKIGREKTLLKYRKLRYFPIIPKLQRLFMSPKIVGHMTWHHSHDVVNGVMVYHFDGKAWKHFNRVYPQFSVELRNVRLGLCTSGFNQFESFAAPYSFWLVILMIYYLPPGMCMRLNFMFFYMVIRSPNSLGRNINVRLRPLIDELKQLWSSRALTYDVLNFFPQIKTALIWTSNDFPVYGMVSSWSTHEKLTCSYCMKNNKVFTLTNSGKTSFF
jgi:hypothetical protein